MPGRIRKSWICHHCKRLGLKKKKKAPDGQKNQESDSPQDMCDAPYPTCVVRNLNGI
jgi:hypothetical protein